MERLVSNKEINRWYETEILPDGVIAIREPHHEEDVFCYLVLGKEKDLLIDTGMGVKRLKPVLERFMSPGKKLFVLNTHWHFDHIGGNWEFDSVMVPANKIETEGIVNGWTRNGLQKYSFFDLFKGNKHPEEFNFENFYIAGYERVDAILKEGYLINLGNRKIQVIETPGHTPGSISLFDETKGLLFTSDLLYEGPLYCFEEESNPIVYLESLRKLKILGDKVRRIHPGHNYSNNSPRILDEAIALFERVLKKDTPDAISEDFPDVKVYQHPIIKRLKVLTK